MNNVVTQMELTVNDIAATAESILKEDLPVFLIRNNLHNMLEGHLKQKIGDVMHKEDLLGSEHFEKQQGGGGGLE